MEIKPSLCCISLVLQKQGIRANTMTKSRFLMLERDESIRILSSRVYNNIKVVYETIKYCISKNWNYRISSDIFPLITLKEANLSWQILPDYDKILQMFDKCKKLINSSNIRCSTHPDQFVVPGSFNLNTVSKSVDELIHHANLMDMLGLEQSYHSPINIHMNIYKGGTKNIYNNFKSVYNDLPHNVKSRLVLENEDKPNSWSVQELYDNFYQNLGIPITYDNLHFKCNPKQLSPSQAMCMCIESWQNTKPLFHFSDNDPNNKNPRAHADYVRNLPDEYLNCGVDLDLDFEFKAKDLAIKKFEQQFL